MPGVPVSTDEDSAGPERGPVRVDELRMLAAGMCAWPRLVEAGDVGRILASRLLDAIAIDSGAPSAMPQHQPVFAARLLESAFTLQATADNF